MKNIFTYMNKEELAAEVMWLLIDEGYRFSNEEWKELTKLKVELDDGIFYLSDEPIFGGDFVENLNDRKYQHILYEISKSIVDQNVIGKKV